MTEAVEILVPRQNVAAVVRKAVGQVPALFIATQRSNRIASRLVVSPLELVETIEGRAGVIRAAHGKKTPFIFLGFAVGVVFSARLFEGLVQFAADTKTPPYVAPDAESLRRMVFARKSGAEKELIASASVENGRLVVWSCEPKRYEMAIEDIPALASLDVPEAFVLSRSGSRIHWDEGDVDLDLNAIREVADPLVRFDHIAKRRQEAALYNKAIRLFRQERGLKQNEIPDLSERQIRRLEQGTAIPHAATLSKLAAAHGLSVDGYMEELATRSLSLKRQKRAHLLTVAAAKRRRRTMSAAAATKRRRRAAASSTMKRRHLRRKKKRSSA